MNAYIYNLRMIHLLSSIYKRNKSKTSLDGNKIQQQNVISNLQRKVTYSDIILKAQGQFIFKNMRISSVHHLNKAMRQQAVKKKTLKKGFHNAAALFDFEEILYYHCDIEVQN